MHTLSDWAALATVLLALETFMVCLIAGVIIYFLGRGVSYLLRELPPRFAIGRRYLNQARDAVANASKRVAAPFIALQMFVARLRGLWAGVRGIFVH